MNGTKVITSVEGTDGKIQRCCSTLSSRRGKRAKLLVTLAVGIAAVAVTAGLASKWGWLVAVGAAPVIVALLPCILMCAIGVGAIIGLGRQDARSVKAPRKPDNPLPPQIVKRIL